MVSVGILAFAADGTLSRHCVISIQSLKQSHTEILAYAFPLANRQILGMSRK